MPRIARHKITRLDRGNSATASAGLLAHVRLIQPKSGTNSLSVDLAIALDTKVWAIPSSNCTAQSILAQWARIKVRPRNEWDDVQMRMRPWREQLQKWPRLHLLRGKDYKRPRSIVGFTEPVSKTNKYKGDSRDFHKTRAVLRTNRHSFSSLHKRFFDCRGRKADDVKPSRFSSLPGQYSIQLSPCPFREAH